MNAQTASLPNSIKGIALMPGNKIPLFIDKSSSSDSVRPSLFIAARCLTIVD